MSVSNLYCDGVLIQNMSFDLEALGSADRAAARCGTLGHVRMTLATFSLRSTIFMLPEPRHHFVSSKIYQLHTSRTNQMAQREIPGFYYGKNTSITIATNLVKPLSGLEQT